jgi:hypothetical protein
MEEEETIAFKNSYFKINIYFLTLIVYVKVKTVPKKLSLRLCDIIITDILVLKTTSASWRQNTLKPAPLGAKILKAFHWKCSSPLFLIRFSGSDQPMFLCI